MSKLFRAIIFGVGAVLVAFVIKEFLSGKKTLDKKVLERMRANCC